MSRVRDHTQRIKYLISSEYRNSGTIGDAVYKINNLTGIPSNSKTTLSISDFTASEPLGNVDSTYIKYTYSTETDVKVVLKAGNYSISSYMSHIIEQITTVSDLLTENDIFFGFSGDKVVLNLNDASNMLTLDSTHDSTLKSNIGMNDTISTVFTSGDYATVTFPNDFEIEKITNFIVQSNIPTKVYNTYTGNFENILGYYRVTSDGDIEKTIQPQVESDFSFANIANFEVSLSTTNRRSITTGGYSFILNTQELLYKPPIPEPFTEQF